VVGKKQAAKIFELVGRLEDRLPEQKRRFLDVYAEALETYRRRSWDRALTLFEEGAGILEGDSSCRVMSNRCRLYLENPPPKDWDGVYVATRK